MKGTPRHATRSPDDPVSPPKGVDRPRLDGEGVHSHVGIRAHELIARVAAITPRPSPVACRQLVRSECAELFRERGSGWHGRWIRQRVESLAQVYFGLLAPPIGWRFLGAELPAGGGAVDLAWEDQATGRVLYDELKAGSFGDPVSPGIAAQAERYRVDGLARHGERFAGVRVLALAAPLASRLIEPGGTNRPLVETDGWFSEGWER